LVGVVGLVWCFFALGFFFFFFFLLKEWVPFTNVPKNVRNHV